MNKKLMMGGILGLVALGAGALAFTTLGGSESGESPAARTAHARYSGSNAEPYVFSEDGSFFPAGPSLDGDVKVLKLADTVSPAPGKNDPAPSTSGGPPATAPADEDEDNAETPADDGEETPGTPDPVGDPNGPQGGNGSGSGNNGNGNGNGSGMIFSEKLNDAICELLGCNPPQMPNIPGISDAICEDADCDDDAETIKPKLDPCAILGNCAKPPIIKGDIGLLVADR